MNFIKYLLGLAVLSAIGGLLVVIFGGAAIYILGLAGFGVLAYVVFFGKGSGRGDDNFPEPPDDLEF